MNTIYACIFLLCTIAAASYLTWAVLNQQNPVTFYELTPTNMKQQPANESTPDPPTNTRKSYCYQESYNTIVFFHLAENPSELHPLDLCAFQSAARANPASGVCILTAFPMTAPPKLQSLQNVEISLLNIREILRGTPAYRWYTAYVLDEGSDKSQLAQRLSHALRIAYLYKYGGIYLDSDMLTLRRLSYLRNVVALENDQALSNAVLMFDKAHPFLKTALESLAEYVQYGESMSQGSELLTYVHTAQLVEESTYEVLPPDIFFPITLNEPDLHFQPDGLQFTKRELKNAYTLNMWKVLNIVYWEKSIPADSFMDEFMKTVCA